MYNQNRGGLIDRFCARHPRFGIPNLMKIIVFTQIGVFLLELLATLVADRNSEETERRLNVLNPYFEEHRLK